MHCTENYNNYCSSGRSGRALSVGVINYQAREDVRAPTPTGQKALLQFESGLPCGPSLTRGRRSNDIAHT
jgi:hypothetical protein